MKKKIFLGLFLFVTFLFLSPNNAQALCNENLPLQLCARTTCSANGKSYCCDSAPECTQMGGQTSTAGQGNQNVTCGNQGTQLNSGSGISTAIGCVDFQDIPTFTGLILKWLVGIGGGVAFLLILSGGFTVMTSSGNPDRLKAGQEVITAAVSGLILLIFSIFVLKLVGIDILGLGAFGFGK